MDEQNVQNISPETPVSQSPHSLKRLGMIGVIILVAIILLGYYAFMLKPSTKEAEVVEAPVAFEQALEETIFGEPDNLQNFLIAQLAADKNDEMTKSAIYWLTHRYFDNGGDIYEIYDFINSHPEVAFLTKAEDIYPEIFERLKSRSVPIRSQESLMALLAYFETIDSFGYGSIALQGLAANKYSELVLLKSQPQVNETEEQAAQRELYLQYMKRRASMFAAKARHFILINTINTGKLDELREANVVKDDLVVGINQYTSALLNLKAAGVTVPQDVTTRELYEFNVAYALENVPRLYFFTNYLYASALVYGNEATEESVRAPLGRMVEYARANEVWRESGSINRLLASKATNETGLYAPGVVRRLAALNSEFKIWLMENGWTEEDL